MPGIFGIAFEPGTTAAKAETVTPGIHVGEQPSTVDAGEMIGKQNLQVADRTLLVVVAGGIGMQCAAPRTVHADIVTGFVQQRMHRRVRPHQYFVADQSGLRIAPIAAGYRCILAQYAQAQSEDVSRTVCNMSSEKIAEVIKIKKERAKRATKINGGH